MRRGSRLSDLMLPDGERQNAAGGPPARLQEAGLHLAQGRFFTIHFIRPASLAFGCSLQHSIKLVTVLNRCSEFRTQVMGTRRYQAKDLASLEYLIIHT
jgi:hypothetical protein